MRNAFARELVSLAEKDDRIVLLMADIGNRLFDAFAEKFPTRFFNCGIAEANMISVAAGLANEGLRPVCYTIAPFITYRCFEQIRVDLCYHDFPVVLVGTGAGLSYASLGATHHSCEDIAVMRALPEMQVMAPADSSELRSCLGAAVRSPKPSYIRIGKKGEPEVYKTPPPLTIGRAIPHREGRRVNILSCGTLLSDALAAAASLADADIDTGVTSFHTVKPLDEETLLALASGSELLVSLEEHSIVGGFGSAVAEFLSARRHMPPLLRLGTGDCFIHETSHQDTARALFDLNPAGIAARIREALRSK